MDSTAKVDVDWGGENVTLRITEGSTEVGASITQGAAKRMVDQLIWALGETARFSEYIEFGEDAARFRGRPKP